VEAGEEVDELASLGPLAAVRIPGRLLIAPLVEGAHLLAQVARRRVAEPERRLRELLQVRRQVERDAVRERVQRADARGGRLGSAARVAAGESKNGRRAE